MPGIAFHRFRRTREVRIDIRHLFRRPAFPFRTGFAPGEAGAVGNDVARDLGGDLRKILHRQLVAFGKHNSPEDRVFELPDVAWPVIGSQQRQGAARNGERCVQALLGGKTLDEGTHQNRDVFLAPTQRRDGDREDVEAVIEVLAEPALAHFVDQVLVGGRDQPHIDPVRMARADRLDLALLHGTQELHLHFERQVADLVEEQGAAVGIDELAGVFFRRAGKGALFVAEENALDQVMRDRATIDGDEGLADPVARRLDGAGHHFLADAGLAFEHDRNVGLGGTARQVDHPDHRRACRNDVLEADGAAARTARGFDLAVAARHLQRIADRDRQPLRRDGLHQEVEGTRLHRVNHGFDAALAGLYDDRHIDAALGQRFKEAVPVHFRHQQVEQNDIDHAALALQELQTAAAIVGEMRYMAETLDHVRQQPALHRIVINDQNM
ncbi:hypothetical protein D9M72_346920 [compost metagenome]